MLKVLYFHGGGSSSSAGGAIDFGHAAMRILEGPDNVDDLGYVTWTGGRGAYDPRLASCGSVAWHRNLLKMVMKRLGSGRTSWMRERDHYRVGTGGHLVDEVDVSTLDDGFFGLDSEAIMHWWWAFQASLRETAARVSDGSRAVDPHTYQVLDKNCATITALALMAGGSRDHASPGGLGDLAWIMPAKMASNISRYWKPSEVATYARKVQAVIEKKNVGIRRFLGTYRGDCEEAERRLADDWTSYLDDLSRGLWTEGRWKKESSLRLAHRYKILKTIDSQLGHLHQVLSDVDRLTRGKALRAIYELMYSVDCQMQSHPRSRRAVAVRDLSRQLIFKRAVFLGDAFKEKMDAHRQSKGVWTSSAWRASSNVPGAHRYELLKTIDSRLEAYHRVAEPDTTEGQERRLQALDSVADALHLLLTERPLTKRRAAVLELCRQVEVAEEAIHRSMLGGAGEEAPLFFGGSDDDDEDEAQTLLEDYRRPRRFIVGRERQLTETRELNPEWGDRYPDLLPQIRAIQTRLEEVADFLHGTGEESERVERLGALFLQGEDTRAGLHRLFMQICLLGPHMIMPDDGVRAGGILAELRPWHEETRTLLDAEAEVTVTRGDEDDDGVVVVAHRGRVAYSDQAPRVPNPLPTMADLETEIPGQVRIDSFEDAQSFVTGELDTRLVRFMLSSSYQYGGHPQSKVPTRLEFRRTSNLPGKHRYRILKDIDAALDRYHKVPWTRATIHSRLMVLSQLLKLIKSQVLQRPGSKRKAAVFDLAARVLFERAGLRHARALLE